ncbi:hypothetical protein CJ179_38850 [Rhodococcus sp. ACS1]|uniref:hypothetical protein n=1 Tax=Rhodococcus sp. ACS1 TaxID=2028570 RepID=UPI000BB0FAED|nr:hypothetical protein [Rhodococcus sp. ACS1]PBC38558.1 hypothetical protein CJ179_38850 [Rhodococcus sp. ACS1]
MTHNITPEIVLAVSDMFGNSPVVQEAIKKKAGELGRSPLAESMDTLVSVYRAGVSNHRGAAAISPGEAQRIGLLAVLSHLETVGYRKGSAAEVGTKDPSGPWDSWTKVPDRVVYHGYSDFSSTVSRFVNLHGTRYKFLHLSRLVPCGLPAIDAYAPFMRTSEQPDFLR